MFDSDYDAILFSELYIRNDLFVIWIYIITYSITTIWKPIGKTQHRETRWSVCLANQELLQNMYCKIACDLSSACSYLIQKVIIYSLLI